MRSIFERRLQAPDGEQVRSLLSPTPFMRPDAVCIGNSYRNCRERKLWLGHPVANGPE